MKIKLLKHSLPFYGYRYYEDTHKKFMPVRVVDGWMLKAT